MRKCVRCNAEMIENCGIWEETGGGGIQITGTTGFFAKRIERAKVAVCPDCGEISLYIENVNALKK